MNTFRRGALVFDVVDQGPLSGEPVVLLHGFPETSASWDEIWPGLAAAGYRVLAPDQRGYSPGARPQRRRDYRRDELVGDVLALADAAGAARFHLVGHDWGAAIAWATAMAHPERVRSLTSLSIPHPAAFRRAVFSSRQGLQSWYMGFFQIPVLPELLLRSRNWRSIERNLTRSGLPARYVTAYVERLRQPGALTGAVNWYRGLRIVGDSRPTPVSMPTLLVWSTRDAFVHKKGVLETARFVTGHYRLEVLEGVSHWIPETAAPRVVELLLEHFKGASGAEA